jgi:hypothetical protein
VFKKTSISRTKDGKKSESEVAMCDRMQMYNILNFTGIAAPPNEQIFCDVRFRCSYSFVFVSLETIMETRVSLLQPYECNVVIYFLFYFYFILFI